MSDPTIGQMVTAAREKAQKTVEVLSAETHISVKHLLAIENDTPEILPNHVYYRMILRTYIKHLGLDEEEYFSRIDVAVSHTPESIKQPSRAQEIGTRSTKRLMVALLGSAASLVVVLIIGYFVMGALDSHKAKPPVPVAKKVVPALAVPVAPVAKTAPASGEMMLVATGGSVSSGIVVDQNDGKAPVEYHLLPGKKYRFFSKKGFVVMLTHPQSVELSLDGQAVDMSNYKQANQVIFLPQEAKK